MNLANPLYVDYRAETSSELSDRISKDLKKRGMKFVGTSVVSRRLSRDGSPGNASQVKPTSTGYNSTQALERKRR